MMGRLVEEAAEAAMLPKSAGAAVAGVDRELRRDENRIGARGGYLRRHLLATQHVARQRRPETMEEHDHHAGLGGVEGLRHMDQHARIAEGFVLPENPPGVG